MHLFYEDITAGQSCTTLYVPRSIIFVFHTTNRYFSFYFCNLSCDVCHFSCPHLLDCCIVIYHVIITSPKIYEIVAF